jgi:MFS family permease
VQVLQTKVRWAEHGELAALFFLQSMAVGIWLVPLSRLLEAHGLGPIRSLAYATSAVAAFVSPLIFGAIADRHASPVRVLRWLAAASAGAMALATWSIGQRWPGALVLVLIQVYSICAAPANSLVSTIVFSRLRNSHREFGPIRAAATFGWMCGCWLVSALNADASPLAGYSGGAIWLAVAAFTFLLPSVPPPPSVRQSGGHSALGQGRVSFRERMGWDALALLKNPDHRVVFITMALYAIPLAAFYPFTPPHLQELGFQRTSAWMSLGQITEIIAMLALATLFSQWRLKWIFSAGLAFGIIRFLLCAANGPAWLLAGVTLHGVSYTFFFITAQIYLNERVEAAWRARAQALMWLMSSGVGNLFGYLGTGFWFGVCSQPHGTRWPLFWNGLAGAVACVTIYFLTSYHGQGGGLKREEHREMQGEMSRQAGPHPSRQPLSPL